MSAKRVDRADDGVRASVEAANPPAGTDQLAYVRAFAERLARAEGLPVLDAISVVPYATESGSKAPSSRFHRLVLHLARPPLDGACIDPRVRVDVFERSGSPGTASFAITDVAVECEKEPTSGTSPPTVQGRALPRAASGPLPFLALCDSVNAAWGYQHYGTVIDPRGDVYTFSGGPVFSGESAHELAVLMRHGKRYVGTLPPAEVDRLVALTPTVERESRRGWQVNERDAPSGGCRLFRAGGSPDALIDVVVDTFGVNSSTRLGPASKEARGILSNAKALGQ